MRIAAQTLRSTPSSDRRVGQVHFDDIVAARRRLASVVTPTPLVAHPLLSRRLGAEAYIKLENASPHGSFRIRGGLNLLASLTDGERARGLVTVTRGHHGAALAHAARLRGVACTVFVPEDTDPERIAAIATIGAEVAVAGSDFDAAWEAASEHAQHSGAIAVHPSRDPSLMAGYATVALEMLDQAMQPLDNVILPVAGGSLAAGMGLVYRSLSPHTRMTGVRASGAPALSPEMAAALSEVLDDLIEVSDAEIVGGIRCLAETVHHLAEGAGAAALAGALRLRSRIAGHRVGIVLAGGHITQALLARIHHGEMQGPPAHGAQLSGILADMEYGTP